MKEYTGTIKLENNVEIPRGNMGVFYRTVNFKLFEKCVDLEKTVRFEYSSFPGKLRLALEEFTISEETKRREKGTGKKDLDNIRRQISIEVHKGEFKYPELLRDICLMSKHIESIDHVISTYGEGIASADESDLGSRVFDYIRFLFYFCSVNVHAADKRPQYIPNADNCLSYFRRFYYLLVAYYGLNKKFDIGLLPFNDFYRVPGVECRNRGLMLPIEKRLYVKETDSRLEYYFITKEDGEISKSQKRDIDTLRRLWEEEDPQNIVNYSMVFNSNDTNYWIYRLPGFPIGLTSELFSTMTKTEKDQVVRGLIRGITSMHTADPPLYHRTLEPSSFVLCRVKNRLKPYLINFDCAKDTDTSVQYTVYLSVMKRLEIIQNNDDTVAPELKSVGTIKSEFDWEKADIYALGKMITWIYTGEYTADEKALDILSEDQIITVVLMCSKNINDRPVISEVAKAFDL